MKITKPVQIAGLAMTGALALAACSSGGSSNADNISCTTGSIKASGSTAQKNAMADWVNAYQGACSGATINYQANGSGAGIQDFNNAQTSFAGSDSAIKDADLTAANKRCATGNAINLPMVGGAIVAAYNVSGVSKLTLTSSALAGIFNGKITKWNNSEIASANPGVTLPDATIVQFHRSDSSGTTDNFTNYLKTAAPSTWTSGSGKDWVAAGGQGSKGNDGVSASVKSTPNSIGYVELSFAQTQNLSMASIDNGGGAVAPTAETGSTAIGLATVSNVNNNITLKMDYATKNPAAYPLVLVTYEITCQKGLPSDQEGLTKSFLTYTSGTAAQGKLGSSGYVPLPSCLQTQVAPAVGSIS